MTPLIFIGLILFFFILFYILIKWKDIHSFFYPDRYFSPVFITVNSEVLIPLIKKKPKEEEVNFSFEDKKYLYPKASTYTLGRIKSGLYLEGDMVPKDIKTMKSEMDADLMERFQNASITGLFEGDLSPLKDFMQSYGSLLILAGMGLLAFMIWKGNTGSP